MNRLVHTAATACGALLKSEAGDKALSRFFFVPTEVEIRSAALRLTMNPDREQVGADLARLERKADRFSRLGMIQYIAAFPVTVGMAVAISTFHQGGHVVEVIKAGALGVGLAYLALGGVVQNGKSQAFREGADAVKVLLRKRDENGRG